MDTMKTRRNEGRTYLREKSVNQDSLGCFAAVSAPTHTRNGVLLGWNNHTRGDAPRLQSLDERRMRVAGEGGCDSAREEGRLLLEMAATVISIEMNMRPPIYTRDPMHGFRKRTKSPSQLSPLYKTHPNDF